MSDLELHTCDREKKAANEEFIKQQAMEFQSGKYSSIEMPGLFENAFKMWTYKDYFICNYKKLQMLRAALLRHGVVIGRTASKSDLAIALMTAAGAKSPNPVELVNARPRIF